MALEKLRKLGEFVNVIVCIRSGGVRTHAECCDLPTDDS